MTEKNYGGSSGINKGKLVVSKSHSSIITEKNSKNTETSENLTEQEIADYRKAGKIAREVVSFSKSLIKPKMKLLEIAEKIEKKITELEAKLAFPVNLSINEIAAHFTPSSNDETLASGLLKIDLGVQVNGYIADTAFSLDLENSEENKKLIIASEKALEKALSSIKPEIEMCKIGEEIHKEITRLGFSPIVNLSGHGLAKNQIHYGVTIPNFNNGNQNKLEEGAYAIEPFATTGLGSVYEGKGSGIYQFKEKKGVRDSIARKILEFIENNYSTLPFCERWISKEFKLGVKLSLNLLENAGIIYQFPQLVEKGGGKVSQAEKTIIVTNKVEITT